MKRNLSKSLLFIVIMIGMVFAVSEALTQLYFSFEGEHFQFANPEQYTLTEKQIQGLKRSFDPVLGWKVAERVSPAQFSQSYLATFGDSHTMCSEVGDSETWQHYLSYQLGKKVLNFGVGGYGTDQAFLRFREEFPKLKTPVVSLGLILENINRTANVYRKFYYPKTGIPLTKPIFKIEGKELMLVANPIQSRSELHLLKEPDFIHRLGKDDLWYQERGLPYLSFPFLGVLFQSDFWNQVKQLSGDQPPSETDGASWINLWADEQHRQVMFAIFRAFATEARRYGSVPVIIVNPTRHDVLNYLKNGPNKRLESLRAGMTEVGVPIFDGIAAFATGMKAEEADRYIRGHATALGNRRFARLLEGWLRRLNLIPSNRIRISEDTLGIDRIGHDSVELKTHSTAFSSVNGRVR